MINYDDLYPHNKMAVDAVRNYFAGGNRKAAIVHATGTGKSYIIAAVAEDYKKVLVVAPNNFVLNETRKVCHEGCEFRTYASVMYDEGDEGKYDLIVLDEFHRSGAEKWSIGVAKLIEVNPQALLLGTSATHIRYLDNARNMADELFDGNVVSHLPLKAAIDQGILPNPIYVSSIYTMGDIVDSYRKRINNFQRRHVDREKLCRKLEGIAHNWENAGGVPTIMRKYLNHDMQRIIVFCSKVKRAAEARKLLGRWFGMAGFNRVRYYNIDYKEKRLEKEMQDFQEPLGEYDLKVAISVNMLNEGVHIPHVDGIIMLRSTISRIIIEQQVGRCLTSNNVEITPVVLDLVNNMDSIRYDEFFGFGNGDFTSEGGDKKKDTGFPFKVTDECRDLRILLAQLDEEIKQGWTKDECHQEALKYQSRGEFSNNCQAAYAKARKEGWLDEICAHMIPLKVEVTYERCLNVASQYKTINEFKTKNNYMYSAAANHGWLERIYEELGLTRSVTIWTYEMCKAEALKYKTRIEFVKANERAYKAAHFKGWLDDICSHMKYINRPNGYWNKERCAAEAIKYNTLKEFRENNGAAVEASYKNGWLDEITQHMTKRPKAEPITKERCINAVSQCKSRNEFHDRFPHLHKYATKNGFLNEICAHLDIRKPKGYWTKERCAEEAKKYSTRKDFIKFCKQAYAYAAKNGWLDEICAHMVRLVKERGYWTKERCAEEAKKYKSKTEFIEGSNGAYNMANKKGWIDEICAHMIRVAKPAGYWTLERCKEEASKYHTLMEFKKNCSGAYSIANKNGWNQQIRESLKK